VGADQGAGKNGDRFSAVQAVHLESPRKAGKRTLALPELYIGWGIYDKEFVATRADEYARNMEKAPPFL
jgi:hypothetical protein